MRKFAFLIPGAAFWLGVTVSVALAVPGDATPQIGGRLPTFTANDLAGNRLSLTWPSEDAKATIIYFFVPRSAASILGLVYLEQIYQKTKHLGLRILAVEAGSLEARETALAMDRLRSLFYYPSYAIFPDPGYRLSRIFGVGGIPSTFLADSRGILLFHVNDFYEEDGAELTDKIERLFLMEKGTITIALKKNDLPSQITENYISRRAARKTLRVGERVEPFPVTDLHGNYYPSGWALPGIKLNIVFFWGVMCLPCIEEMAYLDEILQQQVYRNSIRIMAVEASGRSPERISQVIDKYKKFRRAPSFPIIPDPDFRLSQAFRVREGGPATFFIDRNGIIIFQTDDFTRGYEATLTTKINLSLNSASGPESREGVRTAVVPTPPGESFGVAPSLRRKNDDEDLHESHLTQGDYYFERWEFGQALQHYEQCVKFRPDDIYVRTQLGKIYERRGEFKLALAQWIHVLKLKPRDQEATEHATELQKRIY